MNQTYFKVAFEFIFDLQDVKYVFKLFIVKGQKQLIKQMLIHKNLGYIVYFIGLFQSLKSMFLST